MSASDLIPYATATHYLAVNAAVGIHLLGPRSAPHQAFQECSRRICNSKKDQVKARCRTPQLPSRARCPRRPTGSDPPAWPRAPAPPPRGQRCSRCTAARRRAAAARQASASSALRSPRPSSSARLRSRSWSHGGRHSTAAASRQRHKPRHDADLNASLHLRPV